MPGSKEFAVREFFELAKDVATHEAELKLRLAQANKPTERAANRSQ